MNTLVHRIFAGLMHLYPRQQRDVFGTEMESVFADVLGEASSIGATRLTIVATRELISIMGCGLLARFSPAQEELMNTISTSRACVRPRIAAISMPVKPSSRKSVVVRSPPGNC